MKKYVIKCRKTGREFASSAEHIQLVMQQLEASADLNSTAELQVLRDRFKNMGPDETLKILVPEAILPGENNAPDAFQKG